MNRRSRRRCRNQQANSFFWWIFTQILGFSRELPPKRFVSNSDLNFQNGDNTKCETENMNLLEQTAKGATSILLKIN